MGGWGGESGTQTNTARGALAVSSTRAGARSCLAARQLQPLHVSAAFGRDGVHGVPAASSMCICGLALLCSGHTFSQHPAFACTDRGGWCSCVWLYQHVDSFVDVYIPGVYVVHL